MIETVFGLTDQELQLALTILTKLGIAALMAFLIGWERERNGRPAGIRTHMLLIMGVVLFCEASRGFVGSESSRVAAQVVVGVGFLGAGTILRTGLEIKGLTTAASLWATSAIGMAISLGGAYMLVAIVATFLALFTLVVIDRFEIRFLKTKRANLLRVEVEDEAKAFGLLNHVTSRHNLAVNSVSVTQTTPSVVMIVEVRGETKGILELAIAHEGVISASWENGV